MEIDKCVTVQKLIDKLNKIEDKSLHVVIECLCGRSSDYATRITAANFLTDEGNYERVVLISNF